jgi:hypothetical protein
MQQHSGGKIKAEDENLNKLRTRLATVKSACFAKLPPCEAIFKQHVLRASLQTYVWYRAILQSPLLRVQDNSCSKHTQPFEQTALPLQVQIRSCKKSDGI